MNVTNNEKAFALVPRKSSALEKAEPGAKRMLAAMVAETLGLAQARRPSAPPVVATAQVESWYRTGVESWLSRDYAEATKWYRKAAEKNHAHAQNSLGCCYANGQGVEEDYAEAVKWYRKAAEQNVTLAQCNLGDCYANGQGVSQDFGEAVKWYRKAAEQDDTDALGICYQGGKGVEEYYGNALAQGNLGACYANG